MYSEGDKYGWWVRLYLIRRIRLSKKEVPDRNRKRDKDIKELYYSCILEKNIVDKGKGIRQAVKKLQECVDTKETLEKKSFIFIKGYIVSIILYFPV